MLLFPTWFFFNGGSASIYSPRCNAPPKIIINNFLGGVGGALVAGFVKPRLLGERNYIHKFDIATMCNGMIVGLASITASCDRIEPWAALVIGGIGGCCFGFGCYIMEHFEIDDPVEAFPLHMSGGLWGTFATGLFDNEYGLFYN